MMATVTSTTGTVLVIRVIIQHDRYGSTGRN
jgi:hypothetical protein